LLAGCGSCEYEYRDPKLRASPQPAEHSFEMLIGAAGDSNDRLTSGGFRMAGAVGYYALDSVVLSLRQDVAFSDTGDDTSSASTRFAADLVATTGRFRPFIGANLGYAYGESINETSTLAPEIGARWYVRDGAFVHFIAEYQFFFTKTEDRTEIFHDGALVYSIAVGVTF
jgi:hypothetical protein